MFLTTNGGTPTNWTYNIGSITFTDDKLYRVEAKTLDASGNVSDAVACLGPPPPR